MANNVALTGNSLAAYVNTLLAKTGSASTDASSGGVTGTALQKAQAQALATTAKSYRFSEAQKTLETEQKNLGAKLNKALADAGFKLGGQVEFSLGSDGTLAVKGSQSDQTLVNSLLKHDTRKPSLSSQITALTKGADQLSASIRASAAISQAARYAGGPANVMSLYGTLMQQQDKTSAVLSVSTAGSSLTYPGVLASKA